MSSIYEDITPPSSPSAISATADVISENLVTSTTSEEIVVEDQVLYFDNREDSLLIEIILEEEILQPILAVQESEDVMLLGKSSIIHIRINTKNDFFLQILRLNLPVKLHVSIVKNVSQKTFIFVKVLLLKNGKHVLICWTSIKDIFYHNDDHPLRL
jgi:hypothetical protein